MTCIYDSNWGSIQQVKLAIRGSCSDQDKAKSRHQTHPSVPCDRQPALNIQFAHFLPKAFLAPLSTKDTNWLFFSSDNRGKQLLQDEKPEEIAAGSLEQWLLPKFCAAAKRLNIKQLNSKKLLPTKVVQKIFSNIC